MPRANRHFLPGLVWHLTHRCHQREFLLKFSRDRDAYLRWLYEARKRFGLCVLGYMVTPDHRTASQRKSLKGMIKAELEARRRT
jgi:putative transposase